MFASLIKHVNRQYPEYDVYLDTTNLPLYFLQYAAYFDIEVTPVCNPVIL